MNDPDPPACARRIDRRAIPDRRVSRMAQAVDTPEAVVTLKRALRYAAPAEVGAILTGWHCLAESQPAPGQRCQFAHIPDYPGHYVSCGKFAGNGFYDEFKGAGWISDPAQTYWTALPEAQS
jgi:hypothetical protein